MKYNLILIFMVFFSIPSVASNAAMTDAEAQAINTGTPRDCSLFVNAAKKAECTDFNGALIECLQAGFRPGLTLKACMVKKGKIKR